MDSAVEKNPAIEKRYETLRAWRNGLAKEKGIKPFVILSNRVVRELATLEPKTPEALLEVPGIGTKKLEQYGNAILENLAKSA